MRAKFQRSAPMRSTRSWDAALAEPMYDGAEGLYAQVVQLEGGLLSQRFGSKPPKAALVSSIPSDS